MTKAATISGILFDKDGTLLDYAKSWIPVNYELARIAAAGDADLSRKLLIAGGMDPDTGHVTPDSLLAAGNTVESTQQSVETPVTTSFGAGPVMSMSASLHLPNVGRSTVGRMLRPAACGTSSKRWSSAGWSANGQAAKYSPHDVSRSAVGNQRVTAIITADAVRALRFKRGDDAIAIVKSTEVMVARPRTDGDSAAGRRTVTSGRTRTRRSR